MIDVLKLNIPVAHQSLVNGDFTVSELIGACMKRIHERNEELNVLLEVYDDIDIQVQYAEQMFKEGKATILTGIPIVIKDNILFEKHKAGAASKILEGYVAPYSATVIEYLRAEGVIILGRANMDEFAMGTSTRKFFIWSYQKSSRYHQSARRFVRGSSSRCG
jgi:aspartyl-tRNA(Asn)/glutamyl-tRNA(Gln) amidotransferase subunit A